MIKYLLKQFHRTPVMISVIPKGFSHSMGANRIFDTNPASSVIDKNPPHTRDFSRELGGFMLKKISPH